MHSDLSVYVGTFAGGAAGAHTVLSPVTLKIGDVIKSVLNLTDSVDLTSEFSITANDTIDNTGGTATTGDDLLILFIQSSDYGKSLVDPSDM